MSFLSEIQGLLAPLNVPVETGSFTDAAPDTYLVVVPLAEKFDCFADNLPQVDICEARISIFAKGNYTALKNAVVKAFLDAEFTITDRRYIGYENESGYHHYNVDVANYHEMEE